ncbi:copper chaperone PCu(A)C [Dichotomicrobium thermohalophilum]|uniref:Copper(I)-binding protein n=1 Tax=Dichotomicrobium thermohalophilum TaxID=933063 RepID=A0A397Q562_9HYPH|nr:copper chaperone PCu(A)C [Dichotomicrobium thermohalophilum]RIA56188.1 hypothetical protein BXY53_1290 [Dichotomicrobium thermohalophilum]
MIRYILMAAAFTLAAGLPATAHHDGEQYRKASVSVSHAWTGATAEMAHAIEVYMTIENAGSEPVTLTGADVSFARPGVFQAQVVGADGTLRTREVNTVEIGPGQSVTMQPGGLRIVFNDVQRRLFAGDYFQAHLEFAEIGEVEIDVEVEKLGEETDQDGDEGELG